MTLQSREIVGTGRSHSILAVHRTDSRGDVRLVGKPTASIHIDVEAPVLYEDTRRLAWSVLALALSRYEVVCTGSDSFAWLRELSGVAEAAGVALAIRDIAS